MGHISCCVCGRSIGGIIPIIQEKERVSIESLTDRGMKLIDKDTLLAEIERLYDEKGTFYAADVLYNLKEWLDTLEVKEVDLEG